jgi:ABC-type antimicrobial peptide transport system permease subunit
MAGQLWPGQDPIGRRLKFGDAASTSPWQTVVGVVGRVRQYGLESDGRIAMYMPHTQSPSRSLYVVVRGGDGRAPSAAAVTTAARAVDPALPLLHVRPMTDIVRRSLARPTFLMTLLTAFAAVALVLAAIGTYSVLAYVVGQSQREMGIRLAIGATPSAIVRLVVGAGLRLVLIGAAIGLALAAALARVMTTLLFGVAPIDVLSFAGAAILIAACSIAASYLPARRASRIDPLVALRRF